MSLGIRTQLGLTAAFAVALVFLLLAWTAVERDRRNLITEERGRAEATLAALGVPASIAMANADLATLDTLVAEFDRVGRRAGLKQVMLVGVDGRIVAHTDPERFGERADDPFVRRAMAAPGAVAEVQGRALRTGVPAVSGMRWGTLVATWSLSRAEAEIAARRNLLVAASVLAAAVLLAMLVLGLHVAVVRPVHRLHKMADAIRLGDLEQRAPRLGATELKGLSDAVNDMAASLKAHRDHLTELVADRTRALSEANARLERLAITDGLTGLFNHRFFQDALGSEVKRASRTGQPVGLLMIDVDFFKRFNDSLGHVAGDVLLRELGRLIRDQVRSTDTVARYGGEEFAVVLPDTRKAGALEVAEKIRTAVARAPFDGGRAVTISIGVAAFPDDGDGAQAVLVAADRALYQAKGGGRNRVVAASVALDRVM